MSTFTEITTRQLAEWLNLPLYRVRDALQRFQQLGLAWKIAKLGEGYKGKPAILWGIDKGALKSLSGHVNGKKPPTLDPQALYYFALAVLKRRRFRINDPDVASAANTAVFKALRIWSPSKSYSPYQLVRRLALNEAMRTLKQGSIWRNHARLGAKGEAAPAITPINPQPRSVEEEEDQAILAFVAVHGRTEAAKLLGMATPRLVELIYEIEQRVKERVS